MFSFHSGTTSSVVKQILVAESAFGLTARNTCSADVALVCFVHLTAYNADYRFSNVWAGTHVSISVSHTDKNTLTSSTKET